MPGNRSTVGQSKRTVLDVDEPSHMTKPDFKEAHLNQNELIVLRQIRETCRTMDRSVYFARQNPEKKTQVRTLGRKNQ